MIHSAHLLTKSEFKLATNCPRKLSYLLRGYPAQSGQVDGLAVDAARVEALARGLFPNGRWVEPAAGESPAAATRRMLAEPGDMVLHEATFEAEGLSCRVDILERAGDSFRIYEVKSTSVNSEESPSLPFRTTRGQLSAEWIEHLEDLAFQVLVLRRAHAGLKVDVQPHLVCVDQAGRATERVGSWSLVPHPASTSARPRFTFEGVADDLRATGLLRVLPAAAEVDALLRSDPNTERDGLELRVDTVLASIRSGRLHETPPPATPACSSCEYRDASSAQDLRDGYAECWGAPATGGHLCDLYRAGSLGQRGRHGFEELYSLGVRKLVDIPDAAIQHARPVGRRQLLQVQAARTQDAYRSPDLVGELAALPGPLHFIDFEAARPPIPLVPGTSPYDSCLFQYSCHKVVLAAGGEQLSHEGWLHLGETVDLKLEFALRLRRSLGAEGAVLTWSGYERACLNQLRRSLDDDPHHAELVAWLDDLTGGEEGEGRLYDLNRACLEHYIHPRMFGSTSIKAVLPAVLSSDQQLATHPWFASTLGAMRPGNTDPYSALPAVQLRGVAIPPVQGGLQAQESYLEILRAVRSGDFEKARAHGQLLQQYCQLDTLAMVMVWWHWRSALS
jgi:hypothetical protein